MAENELFGIRRSERHAGHLAAQKTVKDILLSSSAVKHTYSNTVCVHKWGDNDEGGRVKETLVRRRRRREEDVCGLL